MEINKVLSSIVIFILVSIMSFFFLLPKFDEFMLSKENLRFKQAEYEGKFIYYSKIADLVKNIETRKDALEKVNSALPSDFSYASLIYFLQNKGIESGLVVKSVAFAVDSSPDNPILKDARINMNVVGNYQALKNLLSSFEKSARLIEVLSISFDSGSSSIANATNQVYNFNLVVKTKSY